MTLMPPKIDFRILLLSGFMLGNNCHIRAAACYFLDHDVGMAKHTNTPTDSGPSNGGNPSMARDAAIATRASKLRFFLEAEDRAEPLAVVRRGRPLGTGSPAITNVTEAPHTWPQAHHLCRGARRFGYACNRLAAAAPGLGRRKECPIDVWVELSRRYPALGVFDQEL
jgi:hypothetical protein